ncbi:MAG: tail fiber domain-containing protein [Armatimonadetes bacterium]|nr:tail fiber domain-containing protein [Armatimonadota bacterium]
MKQTYFLLRGTIAAVLFFASLPASAQTFFGSGSGTNGATDSSQINVGLGYQALYSNTTGSNNVAVGYNSLYQNTGKGNIGIGYSGGYALTKGSNNIAIGNLGVAAESGAIRIGTTGTQTSAYIAGINGVTSSSGVAVYVNANGQLGTITSSRRFKNDIKTMGTVSDKLLQLRPVTFRYKVADETGTHPVQYGLIAEEVAKVFPDLVQYDKAGKPFTVRYHLLTPMILNELQKEKSARKAETTTLKAAYNAKISTLEAKLASMEQAQAAQQKLLNQLAAYVQNNKNNATTEKANFVQH